MRTLYIDCGMGAAGDMLAAALLELHEDREGFITRLNSLGLPGVEISLEKSVKCGICGSHFNVRVHGVEEDEKLHEHHHHHHEHRTLHSIGHVIEKLSLPEKVKEDISEVYRLLAQAESKVHGRTVDEIHFHEVGSMDALADISTVCLLVHELGIERVLASPVHVGFGSVRCAHGLLPVPAPATAELLKGVPIYSGSIEGELCTPTGAALLRYFVSSFGEMPALIPEATGYGMGMKDFPRANCLRVILGETASSADSVAELKCNVDDMSAEEIGFAMEQLMAAGALDVFTVPIGMKKSRPAVLIELLCPVPEKERFAKLLFRYTSTLGIRETLCSRYVLERSLETRETPYGSVRIKHSRGYGVERCKYEYEDLAAIARERGISLGELRRRMEETE